MFTPEYTANSNTLTFNIMKKSSIYYLCWALLPVMAALTGCSKDPEVEPEPEPATEPSAELTVVNLGSTSAELNYRASLVKEFAWILYSSDEEPASDAGTVFATGNVNPCVEGDNMFTIQNLSINTSYTVVAAGRDEEGSFIEEVLTVDFTTTDAQDGFTLLSQTSDGFSAYFKVPQSVKDNEHVMRYEIANLVMYNSTKMGWFSSPDADLLTANGQKLIVNDTTIVYNDDNVYACDENGNILTDDWGMEIYIHDPIVPGEPLVFIAGEFGLGESMYGWGEGWYDPMFDYDLYYSGTPEDECWTGSFFKSYFSSLEPSVLDAGVDISIDPKSTSATLTFTPDDEVALYCVMILDAITYEGSILPLLDNNEDYLQWYTTSLHAAMSVGMMSFYEPVQIDLKDIFYMVSPQTEYHVLVTAMGDEEGLSQSFQHTTFSTLPKSLPAPEVVVTHISNPYGEESPFDIWFNVKAPNKDISYAMYAANYVRDWETMLGRGYSYSDIVSMGNGFTNDEVAAINSNEGLNLHFTSMADATTRLAVLGYNEEDTPNDIDAAGSTAIAEGTTIPEPDAERVESSLFDELVGEWTATATVSSYDYYAGGYVEQGQMSRKVVISAGTEYPEVLPEEVYDAYESIGVGRDETDALYSEFKTEADEFNARLRGQNRLLCLGFGYETSSYAFKEATPYELFKASSDTYNGYDIASLFYDFGPKWYLQIGNGDAVSSPVNAVRMSPLSAWTGGTYYLAGVSSTASLVVGPDNENAYFSVEVSDDRNTVILKGMEVSGYNDPFYPNAGALSYGYFSEPYTAYRIVSDVTLTRGWSGSASASSVPGPVKEVKRTPLLYNGDFTPIPAPKSKTSFREPVKYRKVEMTPITKEQFEENAKAYYLKYAGQAKSLR